MKLKRIVVAIGTMGTVGVSPVWAADYDHTVDLASQMIVAGDVVNTSDLIGITARGAGTQPLALGTGAITVTVTATDTANARVMGLDLGDGKVHDLGQGSEVNVKDVNADRIVRGIVVSGRSRLGAEGLKVNVDMPNSRGTGMAIESNSRVDDLGSHSQINVTGRIAIGLELGTSGQFKAQKLDMKLAGQAQSIGARVGSSGILNLGSGSSIVAQGTQGSSNGLLVMGNGANITADALNLEISGVGVDINSGYATIDLGQNSSISTTGMGIFMSGSANSSTLNASGLTIRTTGDAAYGLNMNNGAKRVDLGTNSKITTTGQGATGVIVFNGDLTAQGLEVAVSGEQAVGMELFAGKHDLSQSRIITTDGGGLAAQSSNRKKVEVTFKQGLIDAGGRYGVHARLANSTVNLDQALVKVSRQGSDNYGLWALSGGTLNMKDSEIEATNGASGMLAGTGSVINLSGKNQVKSDQIALWSRGAEAKIEAQGALIIAGDVVAENQGKVSMTVADAYFKGGLLQKDEGTVHLKGERTIWDMTKSSTLTDLDLNQSQVNFPAVTQAKQYATLEVATLAGAGLFNMHTGIV
ncbi:MAG: hypothetical protein KA498_12450, partial [Neisseriaceae bacterium]|nr:hypothetical protein [Neisseriaceae bacterium]